MEGEGFSAGVDKGELGFGMRRGFDEVGEDLSNAARVAVSNQEDFFGRGIVCWWPGEGRLD